MSINHIIVTRTSLNNPNPHNLIDSNTEYITKLFQNNLPEDKISENSLKSYYVDYYHSHIVHGGFHNFIKEFKENYKILYYIRAGLKAINAHKNLKLFNAVFPEVKKKNSTYQTKKLDLAFKKFSKLEDLIILNYKWLINHPKLLVVQEEAIAMNIEEHLTSQQNDLLHVKIIKQLCQIINEEFIGVTAGDVNNIYNRAWHFRTDRNYYYMIEKDNIVTLYNSFTKKEITKGRLIFNGTRQSFLSNIFSKILA